MDEDIVIKDYSPSVVWKLVLTATISCFLSGFYIGEFNSSQSNVAETLGWGDLKDYLIPISNSLFALGGAIGSAIAGKISNKYGRRQGMIINAVISIIACINVSYK
jgi:MFS family permease